MFHGYIFGGAYIKGKNKTKKCIRLYIGGRSFVFGILGCIVILPFRLVTICFDNNE